MDIACNFVKIIPFIMKYNITLTSDDLRGQVGWGLIKSFGQCCLKLQTKSVCLWVTEPGKGLFEVPFTL